MDSKVFLNSSEFDIDSSITLKELDPKVVQASTDVNISVIENLSLDTTESMAEASSIADTSSGPRYPSYQPFNEAALSVGGDNSVTSAIASNTNNSLGIQNPSLEYLGQASKFADAEGFNPTEDTISEIKEAQKTLATGVLGIANTAEKGNAGVKFSTPGHWDIGANLLTLSSDGTTHINSPIISSVSTVSNTQSKAFQVTANVKTSNVKNKFEHIEQTQTQVSNDSTNVTVNSKIDVANNIKQQAVQEHRVTTARAKVDAAELIDYNSQQNTRFTSKGAMYQQASSVALTSSKGAKTPVGDISDTPGLEGQSVLNEDGTADLVVKDAGGNLTTFKNVDSSTEALSKPKWQQSNGQLQGRDASDIAPVEGSEGDGGISITADTGLTMISQDSVMSSMNTQAFLSGANMTLSAQGGMTQIAKSMALKSDAAMQLESKVMAFKSGNKSLVISNGMTFLGQKGVTTGNVPSLEKGKPLELREIPELPKLPKGISFTDLENCLPKKYTEPPEEGTDTEEGPDSSNAPSAEEVAQREKQQSIPTGKEPGSISEGNVGEGNTNSAIEEGTQAGSQNNKLPNNSPISSTSSPTDSTNIETPNKILGSAAVLEGGADIFAPEEDTEDPTVKIEESIIDPDDDAEINTPIDIFNPGSSNEIDLLEGGDTPETAYEKYDRLLEKENKTVDEVLELIFVPYGANEPGEIKNYQGLKEEFNLSDTNNQIFIELFQEFRAYIKDSLLLSSPPVLRPPSPDKPYYETLNSILTVNDELSRFTKLVYQTARIALAEGGFLGFVESSYNKINKNVKIVSNSINDIASKEVTRVTKGAADIAGIIPGQAGQSLQNTANIISSVGKVEVFSDIGTLVENSSQLGDIYKAVQSFIDREDLAPQVFDAIASAKLNQFLQQLIDNDLDSDLTIEQTDALISTLTKQLLESVRTRFITEDGGLTDEAIDTLVEEILTATPFLTRNDAQIIVTNSRGLLADIASNNVEKILTGAALDNLLPYIVGEQNAQLFRKLKGIYFGGKEVFDQIRSLTATMSEQGEAIYDQGKELYTIAKAVPAFVGLMNEYKIPALNQVGLVLKCFDLLNRFKDIFKEISDLVDTIGEFGSQLSDTLDLFDDFLSLFDEDEDLYSTASGNLVSGGVVAGRPAFDNNTNTVNNLLSSGDLSTDSDTGEIVKDTCGNIIFSHASNKNHSPNPQDWSNAITDEQVVSLIETLPRLTQIFNSLVETPTNVESSFSDLLTTEQLDDLKRTKINVELDNCFVAPKLNLAEALVNVIEIKNNLMLFKMDNIDLLKFNGKNILPSNNTIIQIYSNKFFNTKTNQELTVERSREFFSPYVYNFKVVEYKQDRNIGLAQLIPNQSYIYLKNLKGAVYSYSISTIGNKLTPIIEDAYVLL